MEDDKQLSAAMSDPGLGSSDPGKDSTSAGDLKRTERSDTGKGSASDAFLKRASDELMTDLKRIREECDAIIEKLNWTLQAIQRSGGGSIDRGLTLSDGTGRAVSAGSSTTNYVSPDTKS